MKYAQGIFVLNVGD